MSNRHKPLVEYVEELLMQHLQQEPPSLQDQDGLRLEVQELMQSKTLLQHQNVYLWLHDKLKGLHVSGHMPSQRSLPGGGILAAVSKCCRSSIQV